jgi:hypothetical protein
MPQLTLPIVAGELALTGYASVGTQQAHALLASGQPLPRGAWVSAVVDTGTTLTCVSRAILRQLGLAPVGHGTTQTAHGPLVADVYRVSLSLLGHPGSAGPMLTFGDMKVLELVTPIGPIEVLVGMDVVLACKMTVDGPAGQFTFDF